MYLKGNLNIIPGRAFLNLLLLFLLFLTSAAHAAVEFAVNVNPGSAQPNQKVLVEITVTNSGVGLESDLVVTMAYPSNMVNLSESLIIGPLDTAASCSQAGAGTTCTAGEILQWNLGALVPGQVVNLSLPPTVFGSVVDGTLITWEATVSDDSGALGTQSATLAVDSTPALTVAIDEDQDPVAAGNTLAYTLRYGNRSANSVTGTQLNFTLPANASFVSATSGGTLIGNVVNWSLATLPAGAVAQQVVEVLVDPGAANGELLESEVVIDGISSADRTACDRDGLCCTEHAAGAVIERQSAAGAAEPADPGRDDGEQSDRSDGVWWCGAVTLPQQHGQFIGEFDHWPTGYGGVLFSSGGRNHLHRR